MLNISITNLRKNIFALFERAVKYSEPMCVTTKN